MNLVFLEPPEISLFESIGMQSRDGLHPYQAALMFLLREQEHAHRTSRQARAAVATGDITNIRQWQTVRLLAHAFDKGCAQVARDLIALHRALENGQPH